MNGPTRFSAITLLAGVLIALPTHAAKLYKWVDADGNVTYSERRPPPESNAETIRLRSATIDASDWGLRWRMRSTPSPIGVCRRQRGQITSTSPPEMFA